MGNQADKKQVQVYFPADFHRHLKVLAAERQTTISYLVERAARKEYGDDRFRVAETPAPYVRSDPRAKRPK